MSRDFEVCLLSPRGEGKCLGPDTPVLMYDGSVVAAERVRPGDLLVGPDGAPRTVLSVTEGVGPLYRVVPVLGEPFVCNDAHILVLQTISRKIVEVPLSDYLRLPESTRTRLRLFRVPVEWPEAPMIRRPYSLGLQLARTGEGEIPAACRTAPLRQRLQLLAGLIDGQRNYAITVKSERLARDIAFIARSVGLWAAVEDGRRVAVMGCWPVVPARKQPKRASRLVSVRQSAFSVEPLGEGRYCGFTLDGDGRFLLGDFTVTHNTEAGIRRMFLMSASQPEEARPIPWAIVRDTWRNLERTTLQSFLNPHPGSFAEKIRPFIRVSERGEKLSFPGLFIAHLIGVDSLSDLNRFQSMQLGGLWLEEPAPAVQELGGGLDERVLTIGISSLRFPCEWRTVQITSNYPDEHHWVWQRYGVKRIGKLFEIPRGENPHLPPDYRQRMEEGLAGDPGLLDRLVYGRPGFVCQGERVTPGYNPEIHRAKVVLQPYPGLVGYRFWDGGLNPACVIGQLMPNGQFHVLEVLAGRRIGMLQLVREFVKPAMETRYRCITLWEDIGDPSLANREQSNFDYSQTAAAVIERELDTYFQPGERLWEPRREALQTALSIVEPVPFLLLSAGPQTEILDRGLRGGWHYRRLPSGVVSGRVPVKDFYSHCCDALSYGIPHVLRLSELMREEQVRTVDELLYNWTFATGRSRVTGY